jgi:membrane-associated phospholipid phosphatase
VRLLVESLKYSLLIVVFQSVVAAQPPYRLSWKTDGPILGTAGLLGVAMFAADRHLPGFTVEEVSALSSANVNAFDRPATKNYAPGASDISTALQYTLFASPLALLLDGDVRDDITTFGAMYLEIVALATTTTQIAKGSVDRPRPLVYNPGAPMSERTDPDARRSFFSGHTTFAFASAVFLSTAYSDYFPGSSWSPYVWAGSLSAATTVAILRVTSGEHFPTDVLVGALVGSGIGYLIPLVHRASNGGTDSSLPPVDRVGHGGMETSLSFSMGGAAIRCTYSF